jgi:hypothetical protein
VLTGAFGILGLLKEFKNKETGQVTKWGRISLAGILLSSGLGVVAQLKESSDQQKARDATAQQALSLAKKTDNTVREIERVLSPLDELHFYLRFRLPCNDLKYQAFCLATPSTFHGGPSENFLPSYWDKWPGGEPSLLLEIHFFVSPEDAQNFRPGIMQGQGSGDLTVWVNGDARDRSLQAGSGTMPSTMGPQRYTSISIRYAPNPSDIRSTGKLKSVLDLPGTTMFITAAHRAGLPWLPPPNFPALDELQLSHFSIEIKNGQEIQTDSQRFEKLTIQEESADRYVFP